MKFLFIDGEEEEKVVSHLYWKANLLDKGNRKTNEQTMRLQTH